MQLRKKAVTLAGVFAVLAGSIIPAQAADPTDAVVTGAADLGITNPAAGNFAVLLDGTAKTEYSTLDNFDATDARGTGAGWNVTVQATQFKEWGDIDGSGTGTAIGYVTTADARSLALNSLSLAVPTVAKKDSTSSDVPGISISAATAVDAGSAVKIASATGPAGMGSYTFTQGTHAGQTAKALKVSVPASAYAKTYRSDVTVSIVTGP